MILHNLAPQRASYIHLRGLRHAQRRELIAAHRHTIRMLSQALPQAQAAGATRDVSEIEFALIAHREWMEANHAKE